MELGETPQETLVREIKEELDADITVGELVETVRLASAPSSPLLWFLQSGLLRSSAGLGGLWFCCLCICCVFRFALDDFDGGGAPGWFLHFPVPRRACSALLLLRSRPSLLCRLRMLCSLLLFTYRMVLLLLVWLSSQVFQDWDELLQDLHITVCVHMDAVHSILFFQIPFFIGEIAVQVKKDRTVFLRQGFDCLVGFADSLVRARSEMLRKTRI